MQVWYGAKAAKMFLLQQKKNCELKKITNMVAKIDVNVLKI